MFISNTKYKIKFETKNNFKLLISNTTFWYTITQLFDKIKANCYLIIKNNIVLLTRINDNSLFLERILANKHNTYLYLNALLVFYQLVTYIN